MEKQEIMIQENGSILKCFELLVIVQLISLENTLFNWNGSFMMFYSRYKIGLKMTALLKGNYLVGTM